jgi:hypothetical protein
MTDKKDKPQSVEGYVNEVSNRMRKDGGGLSAVSQKGDHSDMSVAQDVVRALVERGMINLNGVKAAESVGGDIAPQSKAELPDLKAEEAKKQKDHDDRSARGGR